jgi:molecular chaperone GrpE
VTRGTAGVPGEKTEDNRYIVKKEKKKTEEQAAVSEKKESGPGKGPEDAAAQKEVQISDKELEELKEKAALADERLDRLLRLQADFENFRKRKEKEKLDLINYATEALVCDLVPVLSNFERALATAETIPEVKAFTEGVELILKQLKKVLKEHGIEEICPVEAPFDPYKHEAVEKVVTDEHPEGHVLEVLQTGYALSDRVLKPAAVKVAIGASENTEASPPSEDQNKQAQKGTETDQHRPEEGRRK